MKKVNIELINKGNGERVCGVSFSHDYYLRRRYSVLAHAISHILRELSAKSRLNPEMYRMENMDYHVKIFETQVGNEEQSD